MHIAVIGLGNFGANLTRRLCELGHQVTALDIRQKALIQVQDVAEQAMSADATDRAVLEELGINLTDAAVVSLGDNLAASVMVALHLKEMGIKTIVATAVNQEHERILKMLGASQVIFPQREAAHRLAAHLSDPNLMDYLPLGPDFSVAEVAAPKSFLGKTLVELNLRRQYSVNVIAVREVLSDKVSLAIGPDYLIKDSDVLVVLGRHDDIEKLNQA